MAPNVALVYGSFFMGDSERDVKTIHDTFPKIPGLEVAQPVEGNKFDFDSLKDCKLLIVVTSSQYGMPPDNLAHFSHHLLTALDKNPGCLSHLKHVVYGNGDETYFKTYMNNPRYTDKLLEKLGSKRFFARGETGEPNAAVGTKSLKCVEWAPKMWEAAKVAVEGGSEVVPWDALWKEHPSEHHQNVTEWKLAQLEKKKGKPGSTPKLVSKL
eukprot:gnl/TRDRNA2_/TRDRNA2_175930_c0_seq1.p1 gnl/TRDRNA2_/TRDRNA2_175930_c0~~gnl/TRDRNA2_/TRDRNA2_175930_c0_seq1.p1  ORF type:complete len:235 (+),score=54.05 gnl/TRDRNA2_/TRDRNA2_175930_c0_seq1:71-706(+)